MLMLAFAAPMQILVLEHRFFGLSQPFGDLAQQHLWLLTTEQALADAALFATAYQERINSEFNTSTPNPWLVVGGSYPGAMSAWYRLKYPHLSVGALASSAVINAYVNMPEFDQQVAASAALSGQQCVSALQAATAQLEAQMPGVKGARRCRSSRAPGGDDALTQHRSALQRLAAR
jgi:pimeloyl-ACP methyl ester carboxylesterase